MALIFDQQNGRVARYDDNVGATSAMMTFLDPEFDYTSLRVLIAGVDFAMNSNYQLTDTLGSDAHLVSFGESVTPLPVSGLIFESACDEDDSGFSRQPLNSGQVSYGGVAGVIQWWETHNLTKRQAQIRLTIGTEKTFYAYIANMRIGVANAADHIWKFDMLLLRVPTRNFSPGTGADATLPAASPPPTPFSGVSAGGIGVSGLSSPLSARQLSQSALSPVSIRTDGSPTAINSVAVSATGYVANTRVVGQLSNT